MKVFDGIDVFTINNLVSGHEDFFFTWEPVKDGLVELINSIIFWGKNGAVEEVIILLVSICNSWIDRVDQ
jgi:hypothetical protein